MFTDLLLREQLHRFSNSFQIVAALANQCKNERAEFGKAGTMREFEQRLDALTALNRLLASNCQMQDLGDHLGRIARALVRSFGRTDAVVLRLDRFWLSEECRFRLALIVNELVTNALKHSLCGCEQGLIEITARSSCRTITLTVADSNRKPLHDARPLPSPIVAGLAQSIGGVAEVVDHEGYAARVVLPKEERPIDRFSDGWVLTDAVLTMPVGVPH